MRRVGLRHDNYVEYVRARGEGLLLTFSQMYYSLGEMDG